MPMPHQFASDNNAGMCPEALAAMVSSNAAGHAAGYGDDQWTQRACDAIRTLFDASDAQVYFVFGGTAANALAIAHVCRPYHAVITHADSHVAAEEAGAASMFGGGTSLIVISAPLAKLSANAVEQHAVSRRGLHSTKPRALSITQATEMGTVYSLPELQDLTAVARRHRLAVHMDGARFANAVAHLGCSPADMSWRAGVDVLSFGGVKNGLAVGEAVLFFDKALAHEFEWRVKQAGHLNSKMRLVSAAWLGLLENGVWLRNARHANAMAARLADQITRIDGIALLAPVESNGVFVTMPAGIQDRLRAKGWRFYAWGPDACRLMCAWDTPPETVDRFTSDIAATVASGA